MAAWSSICWENDLWAAVSAARIQRRPQAARHQPPSPGRLRAASPGRREGCGAGGPLAHRAAAGTSPKRTTGGPQTGGRPHPAAGPLGGPPPGEVGLGAGGARTQARPPTPRQGGRSQRPGHRPHGRAPRRGGLRPPAPRRPATRPDAGRPRAGRPAASHQPTPTAARAPGPGPDKAGPLRWGGGGRAGPVPARPAPDRPHTLAGPARHLRGRAGHRHVGGPARRALCARDSGRAEGPRGGRIRTRSDGAGGCRFGTGWGGGTDRSRGHPSRSWGGVAAKKMAGGLAPPAGHDWTKKKCGEDALSPPLAVTADTRYPPVRRSSPKRTRCRPVPCALAMRRLPRPPSCLP